MNQLLIRIYICFKFFHLCLSERPTLILQFSSVIFLLPHLHERHDLPSAPPPFLCFQVGTKGDACPTVRRVGSPQRMSSRSPTSTCAEGTSWSATGSLRLQACLARPAETDDYVPHRLEHDEASFEKKTTNL